MLMNRLLHCFLQLSCLIIVSTSSTADEPSESKDVVSLVPHRVFSLIHAPEVHNELGLKDSEIVDLEEQFQKWDWGLVSQSQYAVGKKLCGAQSLGERLLGLGERGLESRKTRATEAA